MNLILAIDQGTTGTTSLLVDASTLQLLGKEKVDYRQIYPRPGWVEHNLEDIWTSVKSSVTELIEKTKADPKKIIGIGITNQRETTCAYDRRGNPLHHAIVWQDRRTSDFCDQNRQRYNELCHSKTGLPLDPYFSATKMRWLLDHCDLVKSAAEKSDLCLSTVDSFLVFRLTGGNSFVTEPSNASRTMLMNLQTFAWDESLLRFFNLSTDYLPKIQESFTNLGTTHNVDFLPDGIPILSILGDQQAALFGQACTQVGDIKSTYGTGAFLLLNTGEKIIHSSTGLLTTAAYSFRGKKTYALEGSAYIAGAAVQWLRDNLKCISSSGEVSSLAESVSNLSEMEDVLFMPFFTGIGTPYWNSKAKAAIIGLTRGTHNGHIARACLEGIALSLNDSVSSFKKDFPKLNNIRVDGGASSNDLLMQIQSNFSEKVILRPQIIDTTAFGVALGCLVAKGEITIEDISKLWKLERSFQPQPGQYYLGKKALWDETIKRLFS
jgi:glycerol kinase